MSPAALLLSTNLGFYIMIKYYGKDLLILFIYAFLLSLVGSYIASSQTTYINVAVDTDSMETDFNFRCQTIPEHTFQKYLEFDRDFKAIMEIHSCIYCHLREEYYPMRKSGIR